MGTSSPNLLQSKFFKLFLLHTEGTRAMRGRGGYNSKMAHLTSTWKGERAQGCKGARVWREGKRAKAQGKKVQEGMREHNA